MKLGANPKAAFGPGDVWGPPDEAEVEWSQMCRAAKAEALATASKDELIGLVLDAEERAERADTAAAVLRTKLRIARGEI